MNGHFWLRDGLLIIQLLFFSVGRDNLIKERDRRFKGHTFADMCFVSNNKIFFI